MAGVMSKVKVVNEVYMIICTMADANVKYALAQMVANNILKSESLIEKLEEPCRTDVKNQYMLIKENLNLLTESDKKILFSNILKEVYLNKQYNEESCNKELSYSQREEAKIKGTLKELIIKVLFQYVTEGKNIKKDYEEFQEEFLKYCDINRKIASLCDNASSQKAGTIGAYIKKRKFEAEKLIEKFKGLDLSYDMMRTVFERELAEGMFNSAECEKPTDSCKSA